MQSQYTHPTSTRSLWGRYNYWKIVFLLFVLLGIILGGIYGYRIYVQKYSIPINTFHAVFMQNGQVYFGKMAGDQNGYMILEHVYYIQSGNSNTTPSSGVGMGTEISLVRLGSELHAPESKMYINKDHIMFYENLREDSQVLRSIVSNEYK